MENQSKKLLEVNLRCPWWELCDSRRCCACVQACAERRAAAREAADRATTESGVGSRLKAEAGRILAAYPDAPVVYMTSNGFGFFRESEARNHAATLRDKAVITVKRK